jgi:hypothetical protein
LSLSHLLYCKAINSQHATDEGNKPFFAYIILKSKKFGGER